MRSGILSEPDGDDGARNRDNGSYDPNSNNDGSQSRGPIGSLGDYFVGPGLDLLLQHLSENDPNRYGTPPAQKEAVEALLNVKVEDTVQCSVCLDECEVGVEVKEMPCKHKFHGECILPWLELHSSCPVCRYQLPCDESKLESEGSRRNEEGGNDNGNSNGGGDEGNGNGRQFSVSIPWPFGGLFSSSSSGSRLGGGNLNGNGNQSGTSSREDDED
ncbi:E3 ubiquitin-protein ligase ring1-like [Phtheirospermum japonicum]|uniref:RING-type E3 ubiquitin transferase n=1 Tax=Phtheirospermum japonicum TaxID=374723 RepID=A0A830CIJ2_9LAMI|nr:E3 ubiquitin-protein ligase ring1-like [Phtheirospermum japonicum]